MKSQIVNVVTIFVINKIENEQNIIYFLLLIFIIFFVMHINCLQKFGQINKHYILYYIYITNEMKKNIFFYICSIYY